MWVQSYTENKEFNHVMSGLYVFPSELFYLIAA